MKKNKFIIILFSVLLFTKTNHYAASASIENFEVFKLDSATIAAMDDLNGNIKMLDDTLNKMDTFEPVDFCESINNRIKSIQKLINTIDTNCKRLNPINQDNKALEIIPYESNITREKIKQHVMKIKHEYLDNLLAKYNFIFLVSIINQTKETINMYLKATEPLCTLNSSCPPDNNKKHEPVQKIGPKKTEETLTHQCNNEAEKKITTEKINTQEETVVNKADSDPNTLSPLDNRAAVLQILTHEATDKLNDKQEQTVINKDKLLEFNPDSKTKLPAMNDSLNQQKLSDPPILTKKIVQSTDALTNNRNDAKEEDNKTNSSQKNKRVTNISLKKILIGIVIISTIALGYVWYKKGIESGLYLLKKLYK